MTSTIRDLSSINGILEVLILTSGQLPGPVLHRRQTALCALVVALRPSCPTRTVTASSSLAPSPPSFPSLMQPPHPACSAFLTRCHEAPRLGILQRIPQPQNSTSDSSAAHLPLLPSSASSPHYPHPTLLKPSLSPWHATPCHAAPK